MKLIDQQSNVLASVRIAEKILGVDNSLEVIFKDPQYFSEKDVSAVFIKEGYYIVFNNYFISSASLPEIMITGFHETRHAYQYMQIEYGKKIPFKYQDEQNVLDDWKKDFDNPKQPNEMTKEEYINRPTEVDAIAFSYYLADKLLNVKQLIPEEIKDKVLKKVEKLKRTIVI